MALLKNNKGEYNYQFNWVDENYSVCGFNSVWATNKREALKKAKAMETEAHWALYDGNKYVTVPEEVIGEGHCFRMKGMYVQVESMYKATAEQRDRMDEIGWMMTN
jgi:hypothetical protein